MNKLIVRRNLAVAVLSAVGLLIVVVGGNVLSSSPQGVQPGGFIPCPPPEADFANPPEIVTANGILKGNIYLTDERQRLPRSENRNATCTATRVRTFRLIPPKEPRDPSELQEPMPGPTLRAEVGDVVQLTFVNQINPGFFEKSDIESCTVASGPNGEIYPRPFNDEYPNCLHASSTANIHFHGTHTNPNSTGDNVYLQIPPLPRDNQGRLTTTAMQATVGFDEYFRNCVKELGTAPLKSWPVTWQDLPRSWVMKQTELLKAYQFKHANDEHPQPVWDLDQTERSKGRWPIYYMGAFPYCFALPAFPGPNGTSPVMGQLPGTHWYHAHKHGSTAINVMNGMTGAFIIEGQYDRDLNTAYGGYRLGDGKAWNTRAQKILVLNQLGTTPNALNNMAGPNVEGVDFTVNGLLVPKIKMQPGEVQLWRIINTSGRTAAYFVPPEGLQWRQIAQDGVQYNDLNYRQSLNRSFYMAPANRVDLLVKAPSTGVSSPIQIRIKNVMSRSEIEGRGTRHLLTVEVAGPPVTKDGQPSEMLFLPKAPDLPAFLNDISDEEFKKKGSIQRTLVFNSKKPREPHQHTINDLQFFVDDDARINVTLGAIEEWKIVNTTTLGIDHPLHIHINPFQVTEYFDPNEKFTDKNGNLIPRYVFDDAALVDGQCRINTKDETTWKPCYNTKQGHWWDVFAIPQAKMAPDGTSVYGYYKMRSRFVDYPGAYVMHCHILIHEDRGMMYSVEVVKPVGPPAHH
jgi:FtsP/CotA-like multicopper oxidase with cupredoxin domain